MTIDERLEALTQSVELIAHAQAKADERIEKLTEKMEKLTTLLAETGGFINQLARIA
jgi:peptidoglycan hydrolase CwlO-like protein